MQRRAMAATGWALLAAVWLGGCAADGEGGSGGGAASRPGAPLVRRGDEIMVAGQLFHTGTPVVMWTDPGGYDAYRTESRFVPFAERGYDPARSKVDSPQRYNLREEGLSEDELETVRGGGWPLELLQSRVDQFVIHYDVCGTSRQCFKVLHDIRGLSVHFMLDIDGTIYQTMDLKERAWHASRANSRSIGIEIANIGAYPPGAETLDTWYTLTAGGAPVITLPEWMGDGGVKTPGFVGRPLRRERVRGTVHGTELEMYDLTPEQYRALAHLTATLCTVFPNVTCDYPRDDAGNVLLTALPEAEWQGYRGLLGHWHLTEGKIDPGPAFQWDKVVREARALMR